MSAWDRYINFLRRDPRADAVEEVRFHIEMRIRDHIARGMSPDEARLAAEAEFGSPERIVDEVTIIDRRIGQRVERAEWWRDLIWDARVGLRSLRKSLAFSTTAILTTGLGIGVTTAIVSASYAILVRPLPFPDADRLVAIYSENPGRAWNRVNISWPDYLSWREENRAFDGIGLWTWTTFTVADHDSTAERVSGARVSANLFQVLGVSPRLGRHFAPDEDGRSQARVVLISDGIWRNRFGADSALVGSTILVEGVPHSVVGIMPPGFNFPDRGEVWLPFQTDASSESRRNRQYTGAIGRLNPGVTLEQGEADLRRIDKVLVAEFPDENAYWQSDVYSLREDLVGNLEQPLKVFLWSVVLVLLLVCANVANLMLARTAVRSRELALRSVLGASRTRLARHLITESMLIAALGGMVGIVVASWGVKLLRFGFPDQSPPYFISLGLDATALVIVVCLTLVTGLLVGVLPALRMSRTEASADLRDGERAGGGVRSGRLRNTLVMGEMALSVVLMIGALLLMRSYRNLEATDLGFNEQGVLSARITLPEVKYDTRPRSFEFFGRLTDRLRSVPGVTAVGHAQGIPFSGWNTSSRAQIEGMPVLPRNDQVDSHVQLVTPDFFKTIGVQLLKGRWLTEQDRDSVAPVVLVNESMVRVGFAGKDPIGRRIQVGGFPMATVVGVVRDYRHYQLPQPMGPATYFPWFAWPTRAQTLVIGTTREDPAALAPELRAAVRAIDAQVPVFDIQTFEEVVSQSLWRQRLQGNVMAIFSVMSLLLACVGLYGVISYAVAQRTRELGVRMALGASRPKVMLMVLSQSGRIVIVGIVAGLVIAFFAVRVLAALLYGVDARSLATFLTVPAVLAMTALVATLAPAWRATRVNPIVAIKTD